MSGLLPVNLTRTLLVALLLYILIIIIIMYNYSRSSCDTFYEFNFLSVVRANCMR